MGQALSWSLRSCLSQSDNFFLIYDTRNAKCMVTVLQNSFLFSEGPLAKYWGQSYCFNENHCYFYCCQRKYLCSSQHRGPLYSLPLAPNCQPQLLFFSVRSTEFCRICQNITALFFGKFWSHQCHFYRLGNFFTGLSENNPMRYEIYCSQLKLATQYGLTEHVETRLKEICICSTCIGRKNWNFIFLCRDLAWLKASQQRI